MEARRLDTALKVSTFGVVFLGVVSVLLTGLFPAPQPLIVIGVLLLGLFFWESRIHGKACLIVWHIITVGFVAWCTYDLTAVEDPNEDLVVRIPVAAMQLSIFLLILKVYNAKKDRDYIHMYLLSFFLFVSCSGVSVEFYLLPLLLVYLVVMVWALSLFHFRRRLQSPEAQAGAAVVSLARRIRSGRLLTAGFFTGTLMLSVLIAACGALLFVFFPRTATSDSPLNLQGFLGRLGGRLTSGSSGFVSLDIAGIISRDRTPVMRIKLPFRDNPPANVVWRRGALHQYDGRSRRWNNPFGEHSSRPGGSRGKYKGLVNVLVEKLPGFFIADSDYDRYNSVEDLRKDGGLIEQRYTLVKRYGWYFRTPIFSAFCSPVAVVADAAVVACDVDESFYCHQRRGVNFTYTVFSRLPSYNEAEEAAESPTSYGGELYNAMKSFYVQLPSNMSPRFERVARQITENAASDYDKARAIRNYLALHCRYSLDLTQQPTRRGPLYDFLFSGKPGHCEYFATAMVILLRELGIPSRLAYGYSRGQWDAERKVFEVRELDAHAWAEAFINGRGWTPFDATPAVPDDEEPETFFSILFQPVISIMNFCQTQWSAGVVEYTRFKQRVVMRSVTARAKAISEGAKEYASAVGFAISGLWKKISEDVFLRLFVPVATVSVLAALGIGGTVRIRRVGRFGRIYRKNQPARHSGGRVKFYEKMLRVLMDKGITKKVEDTPLEFAERIVSASWTFSGMRTLTDLYYLVRFGNRKLKPEQHRTVQQILNRLARLVPPRKSAQLRARSGSD